jgi:hypothetical protein
MPLKDEQHRGDAKASKNSVTTPEVSHTLPLPMIGCVFSALHRDGKGNEELKRQCRKEPHNLLQTISLAHMRRPSPPSPRIAAPAFPYTSLAEARCRGPLAYLQANVFVSFLP